MKAFLVLALVSFIQVPVWAGPISSSGGGPGGSQVGQGGMSECISLSVKAAMDAYAQNNSLNPIPNISVAESDGARSNGIDIMVSVNSQITYYVIASPNSTADHQTLLGCTGAFVGYTK